MIVAPALNRLPAFEKDELVVVIETPRGSRNKYAFDEAIGTFRLKGVLPDGVFFPYDFGFIPSTTGEDGDPLDILVLLDAGGFPGLVLTAKLIGAIQAEQREREGEWTRNDRLIAMAARARGHEQIGSLADLRPGLLEEIEGFFEHYNRLNGQSFRPLKRCGPEVARSLVDEGVKKFSKPR